MAKLTKVPRHGRHQPRHEGLELPEAERLRNKSWLAQEARHDQAYTHPLGPLQHIAKSFKDYWFLIILLFTQRERIPFTLGHHHVTGYGLYHRSVCQMVDPTSGRRCRDIHLRLVRHHGHIPYSRIQTVQSKQWFYLKPLN